MKYAKEARVGILAIVAIVMLIVGYNYLKGESIFTSTNHYYAEYEKVDNLFKSNPVLLNGYKIGQVSNVAMDNKTLRLTVEIALPSDIKIPVDSKFKIINNDMIGSKAIEIVYGDSSLYAKDGALFEGLKDANIIEEIGDVVTPLSQRLRVIMGKVDTAVTGVDIATTMYAANAAFESFKETADRLNKLLEGKDEELASIFVNIESLTNDLKALSPKLAEIGDNLNKTSAELSEVDLKKTVEGINSLTTELTKVSQALNGTDGSLGKMVNEDDLYVNLNTTIVQLETLLADIEANPCRYFALTSKQRRKCEEDIEKEKR